MTGDEIVHLRTEKDRLGQGGDYEMEPGVLEILVEGILLREEPVHFGQVDDFAHDCLVLGPGPEHVRHHHVDRVKSRDIPPVMTVTTVFLTVFNGLHQSTLVFSKAGKFNNSKPKHHRF